jgi:CheY-like chemotaxis protein
MPSDTRISEEASTFTNVQPVVLKGNRGIDATEKRSSPIKAGSLIGVRVLLIEDDPLSREALELILDYCGAEVASVESAAEALAAYEHRAPTIMISDIGLPDLDGCNLLRTIRARQQRRGQHIPAIAVSGYSSQETGERARNSGFDAFLTKPVEVVRLLQTVRELISDL